MLCLFFANWLRIWVNWCDAWDVVEFRYPDVRLVQRYYSPTSVALVPVSMYSICTIQHSTILSSRAAVPWCQKTQTLSTFTIITAELFFHSIFSLFRFWSPSCKYSHCIDVCCCCFVCCLRIGCEFGWIDVIHVFWSIPGYPEVCLVQY